MVNMKRKTGREPKKPKAPVQLKDIKPKKDAKGGGKTGGIVDLTVVVYK